MESDPDGRSDDEAMLTDPLGGTGTLGAEGTWAKAGMMDARQT